MNIPTKLPRWLFRKLPLAALGAITFLLAGCGPEEWVVWSPNGERGIVQDSTARLVDPSGNALGDLTGEHELVRAWLPDSRRILVVRSVEIGSWEEYAAVLGEDRAAIVAQASSELARLITEYREPLETFDESRSFKIWHEGAELRGLEIATVMYHLEVTRPGLLTPLLEASARKENAAAKAEASHPERTAADVRQEIGTPRISELHLRDAVASGDPQDQLLLRTADDFAEMTVSPNGRTLAFIRRSPAGLQLEVMELKVGAQPVLVQSDAEFAAWSPDGQDLAYTKSDLPNRAAKRGVGLGSIARRRVCTPDGAIIAEPEASEDLAGLILPEYPARVAWLRDGRILFAGAKFTLPATTQNLPGGLTLFALRLQPEPSVEQLLPDSVPSRLTEHVNHFTVSPDGKKIAILGNSGAVSVLALETGIFSPLQNSSPHFEKSKDDNSMMVPAWRNADELTFLIPAGDPAGSAARAEVAVASLHGGRRVISKTWPDSPKLPRLEK